MFEIRLAKKDELKQVSKLSFEFQDENICLGIIGDNEDFYYDKDVFVAICDDKVVGYAYGSFEIKKTSSCSFYKEGDKSFYLEEFYIKKEYRCQGIGSKLFKAIEGYAKDNGSKYFELSTSTKDYEKMFNFYIKMMGLNYWSSYLIKEL